MSAPLVPRLNLAPKLNRPLSLRDPVDYLRLLRWALFFPQALRWYVEQFGAPEYQVTRGRRAIGRALRHDPVQRRLVVQAIVIPFPVVVSLVLILQIFGVTLDWFGVTFGVVGGVAFGVTLGLAISVGLGRVGDPTPDWTLGVVSGVAAIVSLGLSAGVGLGVGGGVALGVTGNVVGLGLTVGIVPQTVVGVAFWAIWGVLFGIAAGVAFGRAGGITFGATSDVAFGVTSGMAFTVAAGSAIGVAFGLVVGTKVGWGAGAAFSLLVGLIVARLPDWPLAYLMLRLNPHSGGGSRMAWLPLPGLQQRLQDWLEADWEAGVHNINQFLTYTLQFTPAVHAVNAVLERLPHDQLLGRAAALTEGPFYWNMLHFSLSRLRPQLWRRALDWILNVPTLLTGRREPQFVVQLPTDTPAQAACAGFWAWHEGKATQAVEAFAVVRHLRHGLELHGIAQAIVSAQAAIDLTDLVAWEEAMAWLESLSGPALRPDTSNVLKILRTVAADARVAQESRAPLNRSAALGRANAALTRLIETVEIICPYPEWRFVREIAAKWRDLVSLAGGVVGEQVLREPTLNPYEGYSGLPVTGPTFLGRADILRQIETRWATGNLFQPLILYGHRRMGKSSILHNLTRRAAPGTLLVYLDMQDAGWVDHTGELLLDLAEALHRVALEARLEIGSPPAEADYADLGTARRALNGLLDRLDARMAEGRHLILAVDEFELVEAGIDDGHVDAGFLPYLRAINQRYGWLALIFAGLHTLDEMGRDYRSAFYGQAEHLRVGYLDHESAMRLITQPHPDFALEYTPDLCQELYRLTCGQPYLLQRLCWELVNRWNERFLQEDSDIPRLLTLEDLEPVLTPDFYRGAGYYFDGVWSNVTEAERELMCILARRLESAWTVTELVTQAGQAREAVQATLGLLQRHDVILEEAESVRFASELMRCWVARYHQTGTP